MEDNIKTKSTQIVEFEYFCVYSIGASVTLMVQNPNHLLEDLKLLSDVLAA